MYLCHKDECKAIALHGQRTNLICIVNWVLLRAEAMTIFPLVILTAFGYVLKNEKLL